MIAFKITTNMIPTRFRTGIKSTTTNILPHITSEVVGSNATYHYV